ncbi:type 1 glutamine amidotransferase [Candidatus Methylacidithermus pantelleriae]|uniref:Glutamine amidotransferase type-1 domain-containing protein n=1 Tax=Candidatus Methylacidithermus pantelleriae TaxID=2744239 RepID=A0A8J2BPA1_9BACT|nr:type 1 glutamine amidotransferase [Candidatus Methylacidithermus pantelleriae]CAF0698638.1 Glutamine amidotransferase type-1 domain-containing protein [Candidatus Methylacidithermus pantelleriae]
MGKGSLVIFQHIACEGPGRFLDYAIRWGVPVRQVAVDQGEPLPHLWQVGAVLVLGGPMNVDEEARYPWLREETVWLKKAIALGIPVLGVCLGGQLLAKAAGGRVTRSVAKEIGLFEVELTPAGREDPLFSGFPQRFPVFQWHGDTFSDLGPGILLARGAPCEHQAFRVGTLAYGVQFHLEVTCSMIREWIKEYSEEVHKEGLETEKLVGEFVSRESLLDALAGLLWYNFLSVAGMLEKDKRGGSKEKVDL